MSVAELLDTTSAAEFRGWIAYAALEPFGPLRDDLRAAEQVSATFAAGGVRLAPEDVFPSLRQPRPARPAAELKSALAAMCPALTPTPAG